MTKKYVSRAGEKLEAALDHFKINVKDFVCLDVGCSTGGFTDCLLQMGGAESVCNGYRLRSIGLEIKK